MLDENGCSLCCHCWHRLLLRLWTFLWTDAISSIPIITTIYLDNLDSHNKTLSSIANNIKRDMEISKRREWVIETLMPLLQSVLLSDFNTLMAGQFSYTEAQSSLFLSFLFFFISLPAIIWTNSNFGSSGHLKICKQMNWNHEITLPLIH